MKKNKDFFGYDLVNKLIIGIEEQSSFEYEPGEIIKTLLEENSINDVNFFSRMKNNTEYNGNILFSKMRKSVSEMKK